MLDIHNHHFGASGSVPVELPVIVHDEPMKE